MGEKKTIKDYTEGVPTEPPEGMIRFLLEKGFLKSEYIIYKVGYERELLSYERTKVVECKCTACERSFNMPYIGNDRMYHSAASCAPFGFFNTEMGETVVSGANTLCPICGTEVTAKHVSACRNGIECDLVFPMSVERCGSVLYLLTWRIYKWISKEGVTHFKQYPYEAYAFDGKKTVKMQGYYKYFSTFVQLNGWEQKAKCVDTYGIPSEIYPFDPLILNGTCVENSKLDLYIKKAKDPTPITYLRIYQKHNNVENLVMQGASKILQEKISNACRSYYRWYGKCDIPDVNWKAKKPHEMLGLTKEEYKACVKERWSDERLRFFLLAKSVGIKLAGEEYKLCFAFGLYNAERLAKAEIPRGYSFLRCVRYLEKQKKRYSRDRADITMLLDYWNTAARIGDPLTSAEEVFPQRLKTAHDDCATRFSAVKSTLKKKEFRARYEKLCALCFENDALLIRPAKTETELRAEGKALHHCVATYAERHASGQTAIFFIRHKDKPDVPYFTLELDEKRLSVRQNRGNHNADRTEEVENFEAEWLAYIRQDKKERGIA